VRGNACLAQPRPGGGRQLYQVDTHDREYGAAWREGTRRKALPAPPRARAASSPPPPEPREVMLTLHLPDQRASLRGRRESRAIEPGQHSAGRLRRLAFCGGCGGVGQGRGSRFGFRVSGVGFRVPGFGFLVPGSGLRCAVLVDGTAGCVSGKGGLFSTNPARLEGGRARPRKSVGDESGSRTC